MSYTLTSVFHTLQQCLYLHQTATIHDDLQKKVIEKVDGAFQVSSMPEIGSTRESAIPLKASGSDDIGEAAMGTEPVWIKNKDDKANSQSKECITDTVNKMSEGDGDRNKDGDGSDDSDENESDFEVMLDVNAVS